MDVQHNRIAGPFDTQHGPSEQVAGNAGNNIFTPRAAISALAMTAVFELSGSIVGKHDMLLMVVADDARPRIGQFAAARQLQKQEITGTFEGDTTTADNTTALAHRRPCGAIE